MRVYGIHDLVSGIVLGPLFQEHGDPAAIRAFRDVAVDRKTTIGQHPADYQLVCFGVMHGARLEAFLSPEVVATGGSFIPEVSGVES